MGRKSKKKSKKNLEPWVCPKIVQGLSVQFTYPSSDEDDSSLHTIDEDDFEETLDLTSNLSEGDLSDDGQLHRESQMPNQLHLATDSPPQADCSRFEVFSVIPPPILEVGQCSHDEDEHTMLFSEKILDPLMNSPTKIPSEHDDVALGIPEQQPISDKVHLESDLNSKPIEHADESIKQPSGQQNIIDSNCRRNLKKVWVPKNRETDATGHDDTLGNRVHEETDAFNPLLTRQISKEANQENANFSIPDQGTNRRGVFMDTTLNMATICSDRQEQHSMKDDVISLEAATTENSLQRDGFQLVQKKAPVFFLTWSSALLTMGRRKKKKWIPWSQWTPVVQGLSTDASESCFDAADLEASTPLKTIEEESELNSEDESCPSSMRNSESSEIAIDDVASVGNLGRLELGSNLEIAFQSDKLGFPEVPIGLQSDCSISQMDLQVNPNSSTPSIEVCDASNLGAPGCENAPQLISSFHSNSNPTDLLQEPNSRDHVLEIPEPCMQKLDEHGTAPNHDIAGIFSEIPNDSSLGQLSELPIPDIPHSDPSCSTMKVMEIIGNDKEGFKKVQKRRRKKSSDLNPNPEHHQDKPGANAHS
ncbi:hypothetical protein Dimus_036801 [Dionaea muscipula]